jgi:hypothetical protein
MKKSIQLALLVLLLSPLGLSAQMSEEALSGVWYEKDFGEQTVWLNADKHCKFVRGKLTLFTPKSCEWNTRGEMTLTYKGEKSKIFMMVSDGKLLMSQSPALITKYTADTILTKVKDPQIIADAGKKTLLGHWDTRDHSMQLYLFNDDQCQYFRGGEELFSRQQCRWNAGEQGAIVMFSDVENPLRNTVLFIKHIGEYLYADKDKNNLLPARAKILMVPEVKEK